VSWRRTDGAGACPGSRAGSVPAFAPIPPYDLRVVPPIVIALALVLALVVLPPSRRLQLAGLSPGWIATYAAAIWMLGMLMAVFPGGRFLFPIVLLAWVAPFIVAPERLGRVFRGGGRGGAGPGVRNVTPTNPTDRTIPRDRP
jgi:hypothetical protein